MTETDRWSIGTVLPSAAGPAPRDPIVAARGITAMYGARVAINDVTVAARPGEVVALFGANGSGRSTTLRVLSGELAPSVGTVTFRGAPAPPTAEDRAAAGFATIAGGPLHATLTVQAHLRLGGGDPDLAYDRFPELGAVRRRLAGALRPGDQRVLAVAAALGRRPAVLLVDELSRSTKPADVDRAFLAIREAADEGLAVVLAEQFVRRALLIADQVVVLQRGEVAFSGTATEAHRRIAEIEAEYLFG